MTRAKASKTGSEAVKVLNGELFMDPGDWDEATVAEKIRDHIGSLD